MPTTRACDPATLMIKMEYLEMPDLKLTLAQAQRLFGLPEEDCERALEALVTLGFLARNRSGAFVRQGDQAPLAPAVPAVLSR